MRFADVNQPLMDHSITSLYRDERMRSQLATDFSKIKAVFPARVSWGVGGIFRLQSDDIQKLI